MSEIFGKDALFSFVNEHYGIEPDYPFSDDASAVLRHPEKQKVVCTCYESVKKQIRH